MTQRSPSPARARLAALLVLVAMMLGGLSGPAFAQNFENLDRLDSLVMASVGANRGEPGGPIAPIDRRLRLAACPQTPLVETPRLGAATVSCPSIGWRVRVPLTAERAAVNSPNSNVVAASQTILVRKGDPVQLVAGNGSFTISRMMIADEDGAVGAIIHVRQEPRSAPVMARVENIGVVRVPGI